MYQISERWVPFCTITDAMINACEMAYIASSGQLSQSPGTKERTTEFDLLFLCAVTKHFSNGNLQSIKYTGRNPELTQSHSFRGKVTTLYEVKCQSTDMEMWSVCKGGGGAFIGGS